MITTPTGLLYADRLYSAKRLKDRLKSEINQLRHCLAKLESSVANPELDRSAKSAKAELPESAPYLLDDDNQGNERVLSIYRNMIHQRQKLYQSIA